MPPCWDEEKFWQSPVDFALVTVEYPILKPLELHKQDIPKGKLREYLLASAACFSGISGKGNRRKKIYRWRLPRQYAGESGTGDGCAAGHCGRLGVDWHYAPYPCQTAAGHPDLRLFCGRWAAFFKIRWGACLQKYSTGLSGHPKSVWGSRWSAVCLCQGQRLLLYRTPA